jgi:pyruvate, water dikinase
MLKRVNILRWLNSWRAKPAPADPPQVLLSKYEGFKDLLESNTELAGILADLEDRLTGEETFGMAYIRRQSARAVFHAMRMVESLNAISGQKYPILYDVLETIKSRIKAELDKKKENPLEELILPYSRINREMVDWVGGKNANLGEVLTRVKLPIPDGFAITTKAFDHFLAANNLVELIDKRKMEIDPSDPESTNFLSEEIQRLILEAPVPPELEQAILLAFDRMAARIQEDEPLAAPPRVSLRSSAVGEDGKLSFAGQYFSVLNVPREKLIVTYKYVVASLFTPRAITYRLNKGIGDEDTAMSVACCRMVESIAGGVAYSRHPFNLLDDSVIINAVWGLGSCAVDGIITPDQYLVSRNPEVAFLGTGTAEKRVQLAGNPEGGLMDVPVPTEKQFSPCLTPAQIKLLADYALRIENHYGCPQDMEWALDPAGRIIVLQTRPLHRQKPREQGQGTITPVISDHPLLLESGVAASPGVGSGPAFLLRTEDDLVDFPHGGVLIARNASPKFLLIMPKAKAIVTDAGSVTCHMASLAREFSVPTIVNARAATTIIPNGVEITVDAYSGRVYQGKVPALLELEVSRRPTMKDTPVYETLKRVADAIVPLRLVNPGSPDFVPERCRSLHDVMRFVHELSYLEMFHFGDLASGTNGHTVRLNVSLPVDLRIIDLGGGLRTPANASAAVNLDRIASIPFRALLQGMLHDGVRFIKPRPVDLKGFFSVISEQGLSRASSEGSLGNHSYAIISDRYVNFSSRIGYHYAILDSYCAPTITSNYITFSFKGGAADDLRRNRRARSIGRILEELGFRAEVTGDRVNARFQKYEGAVIAEKLDLMGRLLQFTRQMDMLMQNEVAVECIAKAFLEGNYNLE